MAYPFYNKIYIFCLELNILAKILIDVSIQDFNVNSAVRKK